MEKKITQRLHILTLVVRKGGDIPLVREKAKVLAKICSFSRIASVQLATAASEVARLLMKTSGGGTVSFFLICCKIDRHGKKTYGGIELFFEGQRPCAPVEAGTNGGPSCLLSLEEFEKTPPIPGLKKVLDEISIEGWGTGGTLRIKGVKWGKYLSWEKIQGRDELIRKQLFPDTEKSYLENLRAKHQEVLRLLRELTRKNRELDQANSELLQLGRDLEILAHERTMAEIALRIADRVRNPATVIGGLARILLKRFPDDALYRDKIDAIFKEAKKLERIVSDFERLAKEHEQSFEKVDLKKIVDEVLTTWKPALFQQAIQLSEKMASAPVMIRANTQTLKVALLHVLKNAVEASQAGGKITVTVSRDKGRPFVSIEDQGYGIKKSVMKELFKGPVTTKKSGTGLGLMMVQQIIKEHQGEVRIESTEGEGTKIILLFPKRWKECD